LGEDASEDGLYDTALDPRSSGAGHRLRWGLVRVARGLFSKGEQGFTLWAGVAKLPSPSQLL
jgi:hypothetical protein